MNLKKLLGILSIKKFHMSLNLAVKKQPFRKRPFPNCKFKQKISLIRIFQKKKRILIF